MILRESTVLLNWLGFEWQRGQWVAVSGVPAGMTVAAFARDLCTRTDCRVRFLLPQSNIF
jgi:hypothetical protein